MKKNGFTIMEAVVVLGVMSIILMISVIPFNSYLQYKDQDKIAFMNKSATQAIASYYSIKSEFPVHGEITKGFSTPPRGALEADISDIINKLETVTNIVINNRFDNSRYKANISYVNDYVYTITFEKR